MIGVLALQGGFIEHEQALAKLGVDSFEIRKRMDLDNKEIDGLILPGGESTVMGKMLYETNLFNPIKDLIDAGMPVYGTCAGLILLAKGIDNQDKIYFGAIDIVAKRNAFGTQRDSFSIEEEFLGIGNIPMTFIRAPYIENLADDVTILSKVKGYIVAAQQGNVLVSAFHPELTNDLRVHKYFLENIVKA